MPATRPASAPRLGADHRFNRTPPRRGAPPARGTPKRAASAGNGLLFHTPSFAIGLMLGAAIVLTTAYLPEYLAPPEPTPVAAQPGPRSIQPEPRQFTFEFDTLLRGGTAPGAPDPTPAIPAPARGPGAADATPPPIAESEPADVEYDLPPLQMRSPAVNRADGETYMLQAASFRDRADADRLRAELLLLDLPATTGAITLGDSLWYRVTVGPYDDPQAVEQAMARLRERNLAPILVRR